MAFDNNATKLKWIQPYLTNIPMYLKLICFLSVSSSQKFANYFKKHLQSWLSGKQSKFTFVVPPAESLAIAAVLVAGEKS
jgi:hypothetical protein